MKKINVYHVIKVEDGHVAILNTYREFGPAIYEFRGLAYESINKGLLDTEEFEEETQYFEDSSETECSITYYCEGKKHSLTIVEKELEFEEGVDAFIKMMNENLSLVYTEPNGSEHTIVFAAKKREGRIKGV